MAILGVSGSNFYSAQNTVSKSQITLEIKKKQTFFKVFLKKFFDSSEFLTWTGLGPKCFFSAKKLWSDLWRSNGYKIFFLYGETFELSSERKLCLLMKFSWTCGLMKLANFCILAILVRNEFFSRKNVEKC